VRNLVASTYVTLDGVFEDPGWSAPYWSDDAQHFARDQLWASDALLMGRKTYEGFAAAWPTEEWIEREGEFAEGAKAELELVDTTILPNGVAVFDYELAG
jgi:dihydrofolate reductase